MDLEPLSTYTIWMTASTKVGEGTKGPNLKFTTQASQIVIWKILVLVFVFLSIVAICILFGRCYYQLRTQSLTSIFLPQWCFQKIPDPGNSRAGLQQHHYMPGVLGMMENEPVIVEVEETAPEDKVQVPLIISNSPALAGDRGSSTEDPYWTSAPSQGVDNSQEASVRLDQRLADQSFLTKLPGGTCFISGYEKHFMPSPEDLLADEWQFDSKEECLGMGDTIGDL
ncbi:interleukin-27 receptor subunit alpha-like [Heptranchias perlo]|uniref:interleukin-27 receptor subunit alpha-like n=1 Tax=Heptranchias perlo TaxID=212740 RepID=UPI003559CB40